MGHPELIAWIQSHPSDFSAEQSKNIKILKKGRNIVFKKSQVHIAGFADIVIKKNKSHTLIKLLLSPFQQSKAARSFFAACHLIHHNLDTPTPLGFMEKRWLGFIRESYYFTECVAPRIKMKTYLRKTEDSEEDILKRIQAVANYSKSMHRSGIIHCDMNLANFLISETKSKERLLLIDLNRSKIYRRLTPFVRIKDISRLYLKKYRPLFFKLYCADDKKFLKWEWYFNTYYVWRKKRGKFKRWIRF